MEKGGKFYYYAWSLSTLRKIVTTAWVRKQVTIALKEPQNSNRLFHLVNICNRTPVILKPLVCAALSAIFYGRV